MHKKSISIIIPIHNEVKTLASILQSCLQLEPLEIIIVINGYIDSSFEIAKSYGCRILSCDEPVNHNVSHAIGAKKAKGDNLLFLDTTVVIPPSTLKKFIRPLLEENMDMVLNNLNYIFYKRQHPDTATIWQQISNHFFHRPDLNIDSLAFSPYAMTKKAVERIDADSLAKPILAQLKAIKNGLRISHDMEIDAMPSNRYNPQQNLSLSTPLSVYEKQIIGNHIEALAKWISDKQNSRAQYTDRNRRRDIVEGLKLKKQKYMPKITTGQELYSNTYGGKQLSVIIPVQNEERTIEAVIQETRKLNPLEIIIVVNGATDHTEEIANKCGVTVITYQEALGNDTGRAIGAYFAKGDILLFIDGDFLISRTDLLPFVHSVQNGVDLALNKLEHYYMYRFPYSIMTACKYAVNLACNRKDLGMGSTIAVPHAFSRNFINKIGFDALTSPVLSQVRTIIEGFKVKNVHSVGIDTMNRVRPEKHFSKNGELPLSTQQIIGDHIEGISYLINQKGKRGLF
ncbi:MULTISPECIES: glycosyltransferase family 2 protein [Bacillus cereus group]|uniref:glycosyltransferase family 2 protein n=1 Tax=Bacillus cereus group TaxID=86661 RepID=UPI000BEDB85D|nr:MULTISPECIES: glycosyltransferase [Bacillus cereus group]PEB97915.1 glycosyl transferase [Bacillus cereus]PEC24363.1 glycosyl transferase [Bacillus thuringiensis]PEQ72027.1 glycosyl transferase [Bacillus cereus]PFT33321.1 glycosyl transferase [Bacillus cereus]PFZ18424.1 glycosyl transferase [Bacillus thuringiensis]